MDKERRFKANIFSIMDKCVELLKDTEFHATDILEEDISKLDDVISILKRVTINVELPF